jgi:hypothetical protein
MELIERDFTFYLTAGLLIASLVTAWAERGEDHEQETKN